ncbi:MAG: hypothetical protein IPI67_16745 [Myxococcales bacterium]|nr:hypothetical protein [Myxococcales bacterium]
MGNDSSKPSKSPADLELIDMAWDDDASGTIPLAGLQVVPDLEADEFQRVTSIPEEPSDDYVRHAMALAEEKEEASGVQPLGDHRFERRTPIGLGDSVPDLDEPMGEREKFDDLGLHLPSDKAPDAMQLGLSAESLEADFETPIAPAVEEPVVSRMRDRYAAGDFTGALELAEALLESEPGNEDAARFAESCREVLLQMYSARLGSLEQSVKVAIAPDQVRWLSLDHRAGFLLSLVDGSSSLEEILDISGMPRLDALRIMHTLLEQRVIALGEDGATR